MATARQVALIVFPFVGCAFLTSFDGHTGPIIALLLAIYFCFAILRARCGHDDCAPGSPRIARMRNRPLVRGAISNTSIKCRRQHLSRRRAAALPAMRTNAPPRRSPIFTFSFAICCALNAHITSAIAGFTAWLTNGTTFTCTLLLVPAAAIPRRRRA